MGADAHLGDKDMVVLEYFFNQAHGAVCNPSDVARKNSQITRPGAKQAMERLVEAGLLVKHVRRPRNQRRGTFHASLPGNAPASWQMMAKYLGSLPPGKWGAIRGFYLHESLFGKQVLNLDLVMAVLANHGVTTCFYLPDDPTVTVLVPESAWAGEGPEPTGFGDLFARMPRWPRNYVEVTIANSLAETARNLVAASDGQRGSLVPSQEEAEAMVAARLGFPFLSLIKTSPRALREFLGDWKPHDSGSVDTMTPLDHVLFRMVFAAIDDLAMSRQVPHGCDIDLAAICPYGPKSPTGLAPLLVIRWIAGPKMAYRATFDTDELVYGEELVVVTNNPEDCEVSCWFELPDQRHESLEHYSGAKLAQLLAKLPAERLEPIATVTPRPN